MHRNAGVVQLSERFEANYHELMAHVPVNILLGPQGVATGLPVPVPVPVRLCLCACAHDLPVCGLPVLSSCACATGQAQPPCQLAMET